MNQYSDLPSIYWIAIESNGYMPYELKSLAYPERTKGGWMVINQFND